MPRPSSGTISLSQIFDSTQQHNLGSIAGEVIGGNNFEGQQFSFSQYYSTYTNASNGTTTQPAQPASGLGQCVAISSDGSTAAAVYGGNSNSTLTYFYVNVYTRSVSTWSLQQQFTVNTTGVPANAASCALSADGNTLAIGREYDNTGLGAVFIWTRSGSTWTQQQKLVGTPNGAFQYMGCSVALSANGNVLAMGCASVGGRVAYIWTRSGSTWTQQAVISPGTAVSTDRCYVALSADGGTLASGVPAFNGNFGVAYIYTGSGSSWSLQATLNPPAASGSPYVFGGSISLSADGNTCAVGAPGVDAFYPTTGATLIYVGAVSVFTRSGTTWSTQVSFFQPSDFVGGYSGGKGGSDIGPQFGSSLCLSGDGSYLVVGGPYQNATYNTGWIGGYWRLSRSGSTWSQVGSVTLSTTSYTYSSFFGQAVAISSNSNRVIVGEPTATVNSNGIFNFYG